MTDATRVRVWTVAPWLVGVLCVGAGGALAFSPGVGLILVGAVILGDSYVRTA